MSAVTALPAKAVAESYGASPRVVEPWLNLDLLELHPATDHALEVVLELHERASDPAG
jgi:hypothetical protein